MSRKTILAALVGGLALAAGAVSAEAAPMPKNVAGSHVSNGGTIEKAHYRHHRHYRHHHHRHHHHHHYRRWYR